MREKLAKILLVLILAGGFGVRLYKINNPVADWHSWRQADTAAVARNFIKFGFDPLHPLFDDLSNVASGLDNPRGFRMVEFPLYQSVSYFFYQLFPKFTIEVWLRLINIWMSILTAFALYLISKKYLGELTGLLTALTYSFMPFSVYYGRAILPDTMAVTLAILSVVFADFALNNTKKTGIINIKAMVFSMVFASLSLLVKPMAGFLLLPVLYLFFANYGVLTMVNPAVYLYGIVTILPFILWRVWISKYPEGIPASSWLFNEGNTRIQPAFYRWIIGERLGKLILGYLGFVPLFLGLIIKTVREKLIFYVLLVGVILYVFVMARGNLQHDYYQIIIIPVLAVFIGRGLAFLLRPPNEVLINRRLGFVTAFFCFFAMIIFSWYEVKGYYWINHPEIVEAGKRVEVLVPKDAKVIAPYTGDTAFLYQTNRQGWPVVEKPLEEMVGMGATHLVIVNPDRDALNLGKTYKTLESRNSYIIFDLTKRIK